MSTPTTATALHCAAGDLLDLLRHNPLVPVLRAASGDLLVRVGQRLADADIRAIELTASTPGAHHALAALRRRVPTHIRLGMGTLLTALDAERAVDAGADFLVTPCVVPAVAAAATAATVPVILGACTPTEVLQAWQLGPALVKVFPAGKEGVAHLKALRDVYPHIPLMPSGGITGQSAPDYLRAGAVAVGLGGSLIGAALRGEGDLDAMTADVSRLAVLLREPPVDGG